MCVVGGHGKSDMCGGGGGVCGKIDKMVVVVCGKRDGDSGSGVGGDGGGVSISRQVKRERPVYKQYNSYFTYKKGSFSCCLLNFLMLMPLIM